MAGALDGRRVAFLAAPGAEQVELTGPWQALVDAGAVPSRLSLEAGEVQAVNSDINPGDTLRVDTVVAEANVTDCDALILPGGVANPDTLRSDPDAVHFVHAFIDSGNPSQRSATHPGPSSKPGWSAGAG